MRSLLLMTLITTASASPVFFRLASLPTSVEPGQQLVLCAANVGTGALDVQLEFVNIETGGIIAEKTLKMQPLGAITAPSPCVSATQIDGKATVVGVALVHRFPFAFRQAQVTASIQVLAPDGNGGMRAVETIPLNRTSHPEEAPPAYQPVPAASGGSHK